MLPILLEQTLNGLQLGVTLFLLASGLTLVLGIMRLVNLAHGSLYMVGAYVAFTVQPATGSFLLALFAAVIATAILGAVLERFLFEKLYSRGYLEQVIVSFGLIMFLDELVRVVWGPLPLPAAIPDMFEWSIELLPGLLYPSYRLVIIAAGLVVSILLYFLVTHTKLGMMVRAGASDRRMISALGINIRDLYTAVFAGGAALAALAGTMAGPIYSVQIGMGEAILVQSLITIVIGGIGSIRGTAIAAVLVGITDTLGRVFLPPGISQIAIYVFMTIVLVWRPRGLVPAHA
ncbi:MAG: branched-chain amino acid ABC transporter permease [Rhizobiales bacterium 65-9]|nr:branched-chain amino acid ABC transporter permease [Hyphomicrobiales bacterium]OJY37083.1 MAG: branched-chain amino acid ABC transporter permease [Rhizobiales bacterium 65-9]